ncbi:metalloregulator ArsR/SmtB family transcription factor [Rothia koreensis]|uniref:ArsR/SmtB family transcription factor n=1 Tax=Rothia koreensis TaxID=592378 RepID=UPI003F291F91
MLVKIRDMSVPITPSVPVRSSSLVASEGRVREAAEIFKALSDPLRLHLYLAIRRAEPAEVCVCELPDLEVSQATVSHHLRKLREARLVTATRRGTWVHYRAVEGAAAEAISIIGQSGRI